MTTTFKFENQEYRVDVGGVSPGGLYRQNAMTAYQGVTPWAIVATLLDGITPPTELFYLIKCKKSTENFYQWVQVDIALGKNLVGPFVNTTVSNDDDDDDNTSMEIEELSENVKVVNECTLQNGSKVIEVEGPESEVRDFCDARFSEFMIDEENNTDESFWMRIILLSESDKNTFFFQNK
jgi:hypothetical protein